MSLLVAYLGLSVVGVAVIYFIGLAIESAWPAASLPAFLLMFFTMLWAVWLLAVRITAPKDEKTA